MQTSQRVKDLLAQGDKLFSRKGPLDSLWQTMAEQFYPMRADFTASRTLGEEFASHLMTGRPVLAHRDLGNAISSMLRPRGKPWFQARTHDDAINERATARTWLDRKSDVMRRIMYDQRSQFVRATKQGDNDFTAFGQAVISVDVNHDANGLLYRTWHLRDTAWCENAELVIDTLHRNWKIEAREYCRLFPETASPKVRKIAETDPYAEIKCRHIVLPASSYDLPAHGRIRKQHPFVSIYIDCENDAILEEKPRKRLGYVIPRWVTVSGSQYAHSPATVVALPDGRMLQQMTLTLLEAGQKAVDPPMKITAEVVQGGANIFAGGLTTVDWEYDERFGKAIEPLIDTRSFNLGWADKREEKIEALIREAFFLDVIALPPADTGGDMTKYEVQVRFEEYIRRALPLFEPMEVEYNGGLCEETFNLGMDLGAFGPMDDMPRELRGQEIRWQFESPLQAANERGKAEAFVQASNLLKIASEIDPGTRHDFDTSIAFRDALPGTGSPAKWIVPEDKARERRDQEQQQMAAQAAAAAVAQGAAVAEQVGVAGQELNAAGITGAM